MVSAYASMTVPFAFSFEDSGVNVSELDNRLTIASWRMLCIPKNKNIKKLSVSICWVGGKPSSMKDIRPVSEFGLVGHGESL